LIACPYRVAVDDLYAAGRDRLGSRRHDQDGEYKTQGDYCLHHHVHHPPGTLSFTKIISGVLVVQPA
jgi:hypothetical protein